MLAALTVILSETRCALGTIEKSNYNMNADEGFEPTFNILTTSDAESQLGDTYSITMRINMAML